jgi:hypothetical protein
MEGVFIFKDSSLSKVRNEVPSLWSLISFFFLISSVQVFSQLLSLLQRQERWEEYLFGIILVSEKNYGNSTHGL